MKKFLLGTAGLVALGMAPASAADLPVRPYYTKAPPVVAAAYDWSGFYIGANGGWGTSHNCWDENTRLGGTFFATDGCHNSTGGLIGGQAGYRWQSQAFVFGIEGQGDWSNLSGSNTSLISPTTYTNRSRIDAFGLMTGQVGYAWNTTLLYLKGGAAVTSARYNGYAISTGLAFDQANETRWGGVIGAGLEFGISQNWSAGIEYDHMFMGSNTLDFYSTTVPGSFTREDSVRQDVDLVTVRVNYRWGGPVVAKY